MTIQYAPTHDGSYEHYDENDNEDIFDVEPDDCATSDHVHFYQSGKLWLTVPEGEDVEAAVRAQMDKDQYWPNCWFVSDHGNAHLMKLIAVLVLCFTLVGCSRPYVKQERELTAQEVVDLQIQNALNAPKAPHARHVIYRCGAKTKKGEACRNPVTAQGARCHLHRNEPGLNVPCGGDADCEKKNGR